MTDRDLPRSFVSPVSDLIADFAKDSQFLYMVDREVQARVREHLDWWWKLASAIVLVVAGALSFAGYQEYTHFSGYITEREKDLDQRIAALDKIAADAQRRGEEVRSYVDASKTALAEVGRRATAIREESHTLLDDSKTEIRAMTDRMLTGYQSQQQMFLAANREALAANQKVTDHGELVITQGTEVLDSVSQKQKEFDRTAAQTLDRLAEIERGGEQLKRLATLESDLRRTKTFAFVMLESNQSKPVVLADPLVPGATIRLKLSTTRLKDRFDLRVDADGTSEHQDEQNLITGDMRAIHLLNGKGLAFEVVAVRHRRLAYDFVMLRIFFADVPVAAPVLNQAAVTPNR